MIRIKRPLSEFNKPDSHQPRKNNYSSYDTIPARCQIDKRVTSGRPNKNQTPISLISTMFIETSWKTHLY